MIFINQKKVGEVYFQGKKVKIAYLNGKEIFNDTNKIIVDYSRTEIKMLKEDFNERWDEISDYTFSKTISINNPKVKRATKITNVTWKYVNKPSLPSNMRRKWRQFGNFGFEDKSLAKIKSQRIVIKEPLVISRNEYAEDNLIIPLYSIRITIEYE